MENAEGNNIGNAGTEPYWRSGAVAYRASFAYVAEHGFDFTTNLNSFPTKALLVYGELNTAYGKEWAEEVVSPFPMNEVKMVVGAGHEMYYWGWDNTYPIMLDYLNEVLSR